MLQGLRLPRSTALRPARHLLIRENKYHHNPDTSTTKTSLKLLVGQGLKMAENDVEIPETRVLAIASHVGVSFHSMHAALANIYQGDLWVSQLAGFDPRRSAE